MLHTILIICLILRLDQLLIVLFDFPRSAPDGVSPTPHAKYSMHDTLGGSQLT